MGCAASAEVDGAAYRAENEVTVYEAGGSGGAHDGGRADVAQKIAEIEASIGRFDATAIWPEKKSLKNVSTQR